MIPDRFNLDMKSYEFIDSMSMFVSICPAGHMLQALSFMPAGLSMKHSDTQTSQYKLCKENNLF